jgi:hypothetical protein
MVLVAMNAIYALATYPAGVLSDSRNRLSILAAGLVLLICADAPLAQADGLGPIAAGVALWGVHMARRRLLRASARRAAKPRLVL